MSRNLPKPWTDEVHGSDHHSYDDSGAPARDGLLDLGLRFFDLARRNWLLLILFVSAAVGIVEYQGRTRQPTYRAHAVIQLRDRAGMLTGGLANDARASSGTDAMLSQIQVLHSRAVAQAVVDKLGMRLRAKTETGATTTLPASIDDVYVAPTAPPATLHLVFGASTVTATGLGHAQARYDAPLDLGKVQLTVHSNPGVGSLDLSIIPADAAIDEVLGSLHGQPRDRTSILDVTAVSHDPLMAQRIANAAVLVFQELTAKNEKQESVRRREFIQQQVAKAEAQLSEAQLQYNRFMARGEEAGSTDQLRVHQSALADIESRKEELESQQHSYLAMLDSLRDPAHDMYRERLSVLVSSPGIAGNPLVTSLYTELGRFQAARDTVVIGPVALSSGNPEVRRLDTLIATTRAGLLRAVSLQVASMTARVTALEDLQQKFSQGLSSLPSLEVQQSTLQAQVETYRRQTERLRDVFQTAQIEEAAQGGQVEIVDLATPAGAPIESGKAPRFIFAVLIALALATTTAYIVENHKDVIRRREELTGLSPLPNLAFVPRFRKLPAAKRWLPFGAREITTKPNTKVSAVVAPAPSKHVVAVADIHSPGAEAYRTLRTNLLFSAAVQSLHRVIVTSAAPKEGKSTTAANLAAACAQQGQKVLLIDCDLRGPTVHTLFNRPRAPGLTNVLIGTVALEDALGQTNLPELTILSAGTTPPNPAELLGSPKMAKLLDDLAVRFDLVIIDTPPLLAASDAAILGKNADGTLMVVRAGQTQRVAVQEAIQQLHTVGARVLGTVLNDPDAEIAKFAPYYYQYYQSYYHAKDRV